MRSKLFKYTQFKAIFRFYDNLLLMRLPIDELLPQVLESLATYPSLVLQAAPGTGKTTRVPPALLQAPYLDPKREILVLEPRRLAAKMSARRVAQEMNEAVGQTVGYQFRFENMTSARTRIRFLTEGMLMRKLIGDPELRGVSAVILDEFHERHLHSDVSLSFLRRLQRQKRPDLRLIVMSATLDAENLAQFLGDGTKPAPVIRADARQFEVSIEYLPSAPAKHLDQTVKDGVLAMFPKTKGDILVFLPGMGEIRRAAQALEGAAKAYRFTVAPLHGELSREEQDAALEPMPERKVILATNVAETSLTIPGVNVVIDSGLHRQASHSHWSGVPALKTRPISRASAIQRTGRAGRIAPGHCLRLYTRGDFEGRPMFEAPELHRADLAQTVLELGALGVRDALAFEWFERPPPQALDAAQGLLKRLGAFGPDGLSALGRRIAQLPAHPRLGRLLLEAERLGTLEDAATLAACIMEGRLSDYGGLDALQSLGQVRMEESVWRVRTHLLSAFAARGAAPGTSGTPSRLNKDGRLRFAILTGFPDRVARKRSGQDPAAPRHELLFSAGGSASIENSAATTGSDTFVVLEVQDRQHSGQSRAQTQVQSICSIQEEWLFDLEAPEEMGLRELEEAVWDDARKRVLVSSKLVYDQLTLSESRSDLKSGSAAETAAARLMLKHAFGVDASKAPSLTAHELALALAPAVETDRLETLLARISIVSRHFPEHGLPDFIADPYAFGPFLLKLLAGKTRLSELSELDWETEVLAACGNIIPHLLDELAPASVALPSGRKARIQYSFSQAPWVESRLQDFLGMKRGPAILRGRVPLTLHLLAPNGRALQVTTDLEGFWQRVYPELRTQLSRRYPRHQWPEKP
jgi:ATP-dependent helicase HrpB